jgi:FMN phosphatase YigB (HAD superfamily)
VLYAEEHAPGGKPSRAAFDAALNALGAPSERSVVFVGDDLVNDIQGARAAGLLTIRVAGRGARRAEQDADAIVTLEDVPVTAGRLVKGSGAHAA